MKKKTVMAWIDQVFELGYKKKCKIGKTIDPGHEQALVKIKHNRIWNVLQKANKIFLKRNA
jgi:hypothetical protein